MRVNASQMHPGTKPCLSNVYTLGNGGQASPTPPPGVICSVSGHRRAGYWLSMSLESLLTPRLTTGFNAKIASLWMEFVGLVHRKVFLRRGRLNPPHLLADINLPPFDVFVF